VQGKIMYIELRGPTGDRTESARIGRVELSKTGKTLYYGGKSLRHIGRAEYLDLESRDRYYIQNCSREGKDRGGSSSFPIEIDADIRQEYWTVIRRQPKRGPRTSHVRLTQPKFGKLHPL
jgi:hypothetical protein